MGSIIPTVKKIHLTCNGELEYESGGRRQVVFSHLSSFVGTESKDDLNSSGFERERDSNYSSMILTIYDDDTSIFSLKRDKTDYALYANDNSNLTDLS